MVYVHMSAAKEVRCKYVRCLRYMKCTYVDGLISPMYICRVAELYAEHMLYQTITSTVVDTIISVLWCIRIFANAL